MFTINEFRQEFDREVVDRKITWEIAGFLGFDNNIYSIGTDTKVISTVFETLAAPLIKDIAEKHGYDVSGSRQTVYPDFTLTPKGKANNRIAIDIKTTYQESPRDSIGFTLGSYTSFLRNGTKNICHPYREYCSHWVIGFVYMRRLGVQSKVYARSSNFDGIACPYHNVRYFVQDKYKIAGLRPGSGNTTNIGSITTADINQFVQGNGPFAQYGEEVFVAYWIQYNANRATHYTSVEQFLADQGKNTKA